MKTVTPAIVAMMVLGGLLATGHAAAQARPVALSRSFDGTRSRSAPPGGVVIARDFAAPTSTEPPVVLADVGVTPLWRADHAGVAPLITVTAQASPADVLPIQVIAAMAPMLMISAWDGTPLWLPPVRLVRTW